MENASKALIMVASLLIGIMLLSFMVYIFRRFNTTAKETDRRFSQREIDSFNAKFLNYETGGNHNRDDEFTVTYSRGSLNPVDAGQVTSIDVKYRNLFAAGTNRGVHTNTIETKQYYGRALIDAARNLNTVSDVVSAINDAIDVNYINNNSYKYSGVEIQASVEVIVDLDTYRNDLSFCKPDGTTAYQYLVIEPNANVKANHIYGFNSINTSGTNTENKEKNALNLVFQDSNEINLYNMLAELRETKNLQEVLKTYTVYQYYFFGEVIQNENTGLVETLKFKLIRDENF